MLHFCAKYVHVEFEKRDFYMKKLIFIVLVIFCALSFAKCSQRTAIENTPTESTADYNCRVEQVAKSQKLSVSWDKNTPIERVEITVTHNAQTVADMTLEGEILTCGEVELDAFYGIHDVRVLIVGDGGEQEIKTRVSLSADEYIIAPISGSMPQLYFTLYMDEITENYTIPAFVWLARPDSWNWNKLPSGVYPMPTAELSEILSHNNYDRMVEATDGYIEELYSMDQNSKFKLYINDYNLYLYLKLMAGNGIPEENYKVVLLSDGGASYEEFNRAFNSDDQGFDASEKFLEMKGKFDALIGEVREAGDYYWNGNFSIDTSEVRQYAYVAAREKNNVEWWVLRPRINQTFFSPDDEFLSAVSADITTDPDAIENPVIVERSFASPLEKLDDVGREKLKELYNFSEEIFSRALLENKRVMVFLGSWADEVNEPDFDSYVGFMKAYYGEEFVYYYKGHPSTPTSNYPHKAAQLDKLMLIDVESSINAELILFFYPDIYMCGYNSSTFMSAERDEMACAIFNMRAEDCRTDYAERVGLFVSKITDISVIPECTDSEHDYFLVEYNREESAYRYSVYDATEGVIINGPLK